MQVAIVGAGAIGGAFGGRLAASGHEVTLIARGEHLEVLGSKGLLLDGVRVPVSASATLTRVPDVLVLAVKTQDLGATAAAIAPVARGALVVTPQNGLEAEAIAARHFPARDVVGCVTALDAEFLFPGRVDVRRVGGLVLGGPRAAEAARVLAHVAPVTVTSDLVGARWTKLLVNLNNALTAATGASLQEVVDDPSAARLAVAMMREGAAVAKAEGVRLAPIPWAGPGLVRALVAMPEALAARVYAHRVRAVGGATPVLGSTLQSLRRGRPTEVDHLNGAVVARGKVTRTPTPVNAALVELVHRVERGTPPMPVRLLADVVSSRAMPKAA